MKGRFWGSPRITPSGLRGRSGCEAGRYAGQNHEAKRGKKKSGRAGYRAAGAGAQHRAGPGPAPSRSRSRSGGAHPDPLETGAKIRPEEPPGPPAALTESLRMSTQIQGAGAAGSAEPGQALLPSAPQIFGEFLYPELAAETAGTAPLLAPFRPRPLRPGLRRRLRWANALPAPHPAGVPRWGKKQRASSRGEVGVKRRKN